MKETYFTFTAFVWREVRAPVEEDSFPVFCRVCFRPLGLCLVQYDLLCLRFKMFHRAFPSEMFMMQLAVALSVTSFHPILHKFHGSKN